MANESKDNFHDIDFLKDYDFTDEMNNPQAIKTKVDTEEKDKKKKNDQFEDISF